jgi:hypothetical protein
VYAVGVADGSGPDPQAHQTSLAGRHGSVAVTADGVTSAAVHLCRERLADPPIPFTLPDLEPTRTLTAIGWS